MNYFGSVTGIIIVDILLSGDNALVIALACRKLDGKLKKRAMLWGIVAAVVLRIILTFVIYYLLAIPYLKLIGGLVLWGIAFKLVGIKIDRKSNVKPAQNWIEAVKTIVLADVVMSLDNVLALVVIAQGNIAVLVLGLLISIPIIVWGSQGIMWLMKKWPPIMVIGAVLLGYMAGDMVLTDPILFSYAKNNGVIYHLVPILFGIAVVVRKYFASYKVSKS